MGRNLLQERTTAMGRLRPVTAIVVLPSLPSRLPRSSLLFCRSVIAKIAIRYEKTNYCRVLRCSRSRSRLFPRISIDSPVLLGVPGSAGDRCDGQP